MNDRYCNEPDSLLHICVRYCLDNLPETIADTNPVRLKPNTFLHREICEKMLEFANKESKQFDSHVLPLFQDTSTTNLKTLILRNSNVTDESFERLMAHRPVEVDIHNCSRLTHKALDVINKYSENLKSLVIGNTNHILPVSIVKDLDREALVGRVEPSTRLLTTPKLLKLVLWDIAIDNGYQDCDMLLLTGDFIETIQHLNLSSCDMTNIDFLSRSRCLTWLSLYRVPFEGNAFAILGQLKQLRHLDISETECIDDNPNEILADLVTSLPRLTSLDISGTNLAGTGEEARIVECDIPGLNSRINSPLEFLGLYSTEHEASHRQHIPAKRIAGDKDESQIFTAFTAYMDRPEVLENILDDLRDLYRRQNGTDMRTALRLIITAMRSHMDEKYVQISGCATLFHALKNKDLSEINPVMKKTILSTLVNSMEIHKDPTLVGNGCAILCMFEITRDVSPIFEKLANLLLDLLSLMHLDDSAERRAMIVLDRLTRGVEMEHKELWDHRVISMMLDIIEDRLSKQDCGFVMERAWVTMGNVTDERPHNCERFLEHRGMELFLKCLKAFPNEPGLKSNMMFPVVNVAEVQHLRPKLTTSELFNVFYRFLDSTEDDNDVSYKAAEVLTRVLSDGTAAWTVLSPRREDVLGRIRRNVKCWGVQSIKYIYSSLGPIFRLLNVTHTTECQLWAAWALASLTKFYPDRYVPMLVTEGALEVLNNLSSGDEDVFNFASLTLMQSQIFLSTKKA